MAITAYTGLPGSGKSYSVVKFVMIQRLVQSAKYRAKGKPGIDIFTNVPMMNDHIEAKHGQRVHQLDMEQVASDEWSWKDEIPAGSLVVLDELWRLWPSGVSDKQARFIDKEFLAEHRHEVGANGHNTEVVLVCQDLGQIAMFARRLVAYTYRMTKMDNIGLESRFNVHIYSGAVTGNQPPKSKITRSMLGQKLSLIHI